MSQYLITILATCFIFLFLLILLIYSQKGKKAKAEGYTQGDYTLFQTAKVTDFLQAKHPLEVLSAVNEVSCPFSFCRLYRKCFFLSFHDPENCVYFMLFFR